MNPEVIFHKTKKSGAYGAFAPDISNQRGHMHPRNMPLVKFEKSMFLPMIKKSTHGGTGGRRKK